MTLMLGSSFLGLATPWMAGKLTLAHLLVRFDEPDQGEILVDDIPISQVTLQSLRSQIGMVQQHELLHQRTVILITHRPESLKLADRILALENGQLKLPADQSLT